MKFLIQSQVFIALIAVAYSVETEVLLNQNPELHPYLFLVFLATFLVYSLSRATINSERKPLTWFMVALRAAIFILITIAFWARWQVVVTLIPLAIVSILYTFPLTPFNKRLVTLREIPYVKIFAITMVWSLVTVLLPVVRMQQAFNFHVLLIFAERVIFVFVLALMFDIRDMEHDQRSGLKTIPLRIGKEQSQRLCRWLLLIFLVIAIVHYWPAQPEVLPAMALSALGAFILIRETIFKDQSEYYFALVDSMMLVQAALVIISFYLSGNRI